MDGRPRAPQQVALRCGLCPMPGPVDVAPGRGLVPIYAIEKIAAIVEATLQTKPAGMMH